MAWVESHQTLRDHPKTRRLARLLGCTVPAAVGHLHYLWWWCLDYAQDGDLSRWTNGDVAEACLWPGDPEEFVLALRDAGFVDWDGDDRRVHEWDDYAGRLIEKRAANAERMRQARAANVRRTSTARSSTVDARAGATVPNQTKPMGTPLPPSAGAEGGTADAAPETSPPPASTRSGTTGHGGRRARASPGPSQYIPTPEETQAMLRRQREEAASS